MPLRPAYPLEIPAPGAPARSLLRAAGELPFPGGVVGPVIPDARCWQGVVSALTLDCEDHTLGIPQFDEDEGWSTRGRFRAWTPFAAWAGDSCPSSTREADVEAELRQGLVADAARQVGEEFWTGAAARLGTVAEADVPDADDETTWGNLYLTHPTVEVLGSPTGTPPVAALGLLEARAARLAGSAMIHASPLLATVWIHLGLLDTGGAAGLTTKLGTPVVVDPGYPGTGPRTVDPDDDEVFIDAPAEGGVSWAYATSRVFVLRGPVSDAIGGFDTRENRVTWRVEQPYLPLFDGCLHVAVAVDLSTLVPA